MISADGLSLYLAQFPVAGGTYDIYVTTRNTIASEFNTPERLMNVNDPALDDAPSYIDPTGTILYFTRNIPSKGGGEIYRATRTSTSEAFTNAVPVSELNVDSANDSNAVLTSDQLTLYFISDRSGGRGCWDIMRARRSTVADGFGTPSYVPN